MKTCKLILAAAGATVLLGTLLSSASARNLSLTSQTLRASFSEVNFNAPFGTTRCHVTLEGSLHRTTMPKVAGTLMGYITAAILGPCATGTATIHRTTLPWHVRYSGFAGALPNINSIITHVIGASWSVREPEGITCSARSTAAEPAIGNYHVGAGGRLETAEIRGSIRTGPECFGVRGTFSSNRGPVSQLGATHTAVTVRLI
jgi:hypothetical protein